MKRRDFIKSSLAACSALGLGMGGKRMESGLVLREVEALIQGQFKKCDLVVREGRIAGILPPGSAPPSEQEIKSPGLYVSPGWVDLHVHYVDFRHGKSAGSSLSRLGTRLGVTALVDAGTTGASNFGRAVRAIKDKREPVECKALLNIKKEGIKLTSFYNTRPGWDDIPAMERVMDEHGDLIPGLKLRADKMVSPRSDRLYYVRKIREAGDRLGLPVVIHIGAPPPYLEEILPYLKEGDVVCHFLRGQGNCIIDGRGKVSDAVKDARARGVKFDLAHGMASFSFEAAERALDQDFTDFTISSDLYIMSQFLYAKTFANVLTNMLALGMPLPELMERASTRPARFLGLSRELKERAEATLTVFRVAEGDFTCKDTVKETRKTDRRIIPEWTLIKGRAFPAGDIDRKLFL